jgi:ABC-type uncharacterized transport system ATPase subunit
MTIELEATGIVKRYGPLLANDHVDLSVLRGEVHAVMGENGAGKSTLMSILYGMQAPDAGRILLRGQEMRYRSALDAIGAGMGMVHQAFKLFNSLTVWENVVYGMEPARGLFIDRRAAAAKVAALAERYRLQVDPNAVVGKLSVGVRQRVEILKALYRDARVLILDEPTAVLTPQERDGLFDIIRHLTADDRTILFVTHKLHEVMAITDRVTVLRDGKVVERMVTSETSAREIIRAMTGRAVNLTVEKRPAEPGAVVLEARGLTVASDGGKPVVDRVDLEIRAGEIVGIAGVAGNGQTELIEALTGLRIPDGGRVAIHGADVTTLDVERHRDAGLAYIPEDRATTGTALAASAADNLAMGFQRKEPLARGRRRDPCEGADRALRRQDRLRAACRRHALGRQFAEGGGRARTLACRAPPDRRAADARRRCRRHRVHPRPTRRRARPGRGRAARLRRADGDPGAFGSRPRHVRRPHPGGASRRRGRRGDAGPADGRPRPRRPSVRRHGGRMSIPAGMGASDQFGKHPPGHQFNQGGARQLAPRRLFVDCRQDAGVDREIGLGRTTGVANQRYDSEARPVPQSLGDLRVAADLFQRARRRDACCLFRHMDPVAQRFGSLGKRLVDRAAHGDATRQVGERHAIGSGLSIHQRDIAGHDFPSFSAPAGQLGDAAGNARRQPAMTRQDHWMDVRRMAIGIVVGPVPEKLPPLPRQTRQDLGAIQFEIHDGIPLRHAPIWAHRPAEVKRRRTEAA